MKVYIIKNILDNRRIALFTPAFPVTLEEVKEKIDKDAIELDERDLPLDNYWFNAMTYENGKVIINIELAKEQTIKRIREERKSVLEQLDILFQRAIEGKKKKQKIEEEKQRLRDLPLVVENMTLEEMKNLKIDTNIVYEDLEEEIITLNENGNIDIEPLVEENRILKDKVNYLEYNLQQLKEILKKNYVI